MLSKLPSLLFVFVAAFVMFSMPAEAGKPSCASKPRPTCGDEFGGNGGRNGAGSPGPIAGVGLPFLIGGVVAYKRRKNKLSDK